MWLVSGKFNYRPNTNTGPPFFAQNELKVQFCRVAPTRPLKLFQNPSTTKGIQTSFYIVVVSHYNDYLDRLCCGLGRGEVTYFYIGEVFCIFAEISEKNVQTFQCSPHSPTYVEVGNLTPAPSSNQSIKVVIVVAYSYYV